MGYDVGFCGKIEVHKQAINDAFNEKMNYVITYRDPYEIVNETDDTITITFSDYYNIEEYYICDAILCIEKYTIAGEIDFYGEDNCFWRYYFHPDRKCWVWQEGHIEYESGGETIASAIGYETIASTGGY